jgi:hypothetical protein
VRASPDERWIPAKPGFLFPVRGLSVAFRRKYLEALRQSFEAEQLDFAGETTALAEPSAFRAFWADNVTKALTSSLLLTPPGLPVADRAACIVQSLFVTAFASQRCSKSEESAASLRRMVVPLVLSFYPFAVLVASAGLSRSAPLRSRSGAVPDGNLQ